MPSCRESDDHEICSLPLPCVGFFAHLSEELFVSRALLDHERNFGHRLPVVECLRAFRNQLVGTQVGHVPQLSFILPKGAEEEEYVWTLPGISQFHDADKTTSVVPRKLSCPVFIRSDQAPNELHLHGLSTKVSVRIQLECFLKVRDRLSKFLLVSPSFEPVVREERALVRMKAIGRFFVFSQKGALLLDPDQGLIGLVRFIVGNRDVIV